MPIRVGTGSWADDEYVGVLYPKGLSPKCRLEEYAKHFRHVEVNSSYYATPKVDAVRGWIEQTPRNFTFSIKLHRAFSQSPLKAAQKGFFLDALLKAVEPLVAAKRLAAFLLVLPPTFRPGKRRLEELDTLAEKLRPFSLAVELRDRAWVDGEERLRTIRYFRERKLIWVAVDMPRVAGSALMPAVDKVTHPKKAYLRLHGRNPAYLEAKTAAEGHRYSYTARDLASIAKRVKTLSAAAKDVFVIANNHAEDFAPRAALALQAKLE